MIVKVTKKVRPVLRVLGTGKGTKLPSVYVSLPVGHKGEVLSGYGSEVLQVQFEPVKTGANMVAIQSCWILRSVVEI